MFKNLGKIKNTKLFKRCLTDSAVQVEKYSKSLSLLHWVQGVSL